MRFLSTTSLSPTCTINYHRSKQHTHAHETVMVSGIPIIEREFLLCFVPVRTALFQVSALYRTGCH